MRKKEAYELVIILSELDLPITKVLEVGGSTREYREIIKITFEI